MKHLIHLKGGETNMDQETKQGRCGFSKTKYFEIEKQIKKVLAINESAQVLDIIKTVLHFDPSITSYNQQVKVCVDRQRHKKKQEKLLINKTT